MTEDETEPRVPAAQGTPRAVRAAVMTIGLFVVSDVAALVQGIVAGTMSGLDLAGGIVVTAIGWRSRCCWRGRCGGAAAPDASC